MKIKNIVFVLLGVLLITVFVGCSNKDEEDAERISVMEEKVDALFNQEKTDLAENVETKQFEEIDELLEAEEGVEFSEENALRIGSVILYLNEAVHMHGFQEQVLELVSEDGVVNEEAYFEAKEQVNEFENKELFYERQVIELEKIEELYQQQLAQKEHVEKTEKAMAKLFNEDQEVIDDVTKKAYDKVAKLVKDVEDEGLKESLELELKKVDKKLKAIAKAEKEAEEKRIAEEKRLAEEKKKEEEAKRQAEAQQQSSQSSNTSQSTKSNTQSNTQTASKGSDNKGSSNKSTSVNNNQSKPKQQSKPKEQPEKEREIVRFPNNNIGNSGKEFATPEEAEAWANKVWKDPNSKWYKHGWSMYGVMYGYYDENNRAIPTKTTYTIRFF